MGVSEQLTWLDSSLWDGKAFDGQWATALSSVRDVKEPATGQVLSRVGIASAADMRAAIGRAQAAQPAWAAMGPRERSAVFHRAAALFQQHFGELAMTIARETGGIVPKGQHEVNESITLCHLAAGLPMQAQGQILPSAAGRMSLARRVPHGVV
ncbi:MAG: aldehyde dehydrogenase family protein, partial [Hydrogenophaga sp.]|nr:aldehyde dehydrogenase family protein [Hydrogenophaga sp.]